MAAAVGRLPSSATPIDRVAAAIRAHTLSIVGRSAYASAQARIVGQLPSELARRHRKDMRAYGEYWHDLFASAQAAGEIDGDVDVFVARMLAFGAMNWTSEWFVAGKEMSADDLADQTVRMFLHGVASAERAPDRSEVRIDSPSSGGDAAAQQSTGGMRRGEIHVLHGRLDIGLMFSFRNPAAWRRPFPEVYRDELGLITHAEELGYDTIWLTEHHFADDGYSPSIIPLAAAVAAQTERVRIGFNLLLLPLHNAIRVAEDIATLDVLSGGRIDVGLGQGYARHEFAGYGIDRGERLGRFREGLDVLEGLWTNDTFSYAGEHYQIDEARLTPKPVQQPMPPLWIGATSPPGVRRAGRRGANLLGLTNPRLQEVYEQARTEAGLDLDGRQDAAAPLDPRGRERRCGVGRGGAALPPPARGVRRSGWSRPMTPATGSPAPRSRDVDELRTSRPVLFEPVFGAPDTVAAALDRSIGRVRTTHLALGVLPGMDPRRTRASMERFATDVAPQLS